MRKRRESEVLGGNPVLGREEFEVRFITVDLSTLPLCSTECPEAVLFSEALRESLEWEHLHL